MPQIKQMWRSLEYEIIDQEFEFINLLKSNLGGDVYFKGFQFKEHELFDCFFSSGRLDTNGFNDEFLLSDRILNTFGRPEDVQFESRTFAIDKSPEFELKSEFIIDGELASLLYYGGAYGSRYKEESKHIKDKARRFCKELFNEKYGYENVRYFTSLKAWNTWFYDFIIDKTYLIICLETRTIWMLAFTDID